MVVVVAAADNLASNFDFAVANHLDCSPRKQAIKMSHSANLAAAGSSALVGRQNNDSRERNEPNNNNNSSANMRPPTSSSQRPTASVAAMPAKQAAQQSAPKTPNQVRDFILLTPYPVEPGHTLISIVRLNPADWRPEMRASASFVAEGDNAGIIINKPASIMDYNKAQAGQKERQQPPSAKMSFKVFLINSETSKLTLEHRTLRFWLDHSPVVGGGGGKNGNGRFKDDNNDDYTRDDNDEYLKSTRTFANIKLESSHLAQAYFCQLIGSKPDDFPKNYVAFIMKLMRLLKASQFSRVIRMEVELRQLAHEDHTKPPSRACKY